MDYFAIALQSKKTLDIPYDDVRRDISALWSDPVNRTRHALLNCGHHYGTSIYVVNIDANGAMSLIDLGDAMDKAIVGLCPKPGTFNSQGVWVPEYSLDDPSAVIHGANVDVPYVAELLKSDDAEVVSGVVTLRLADGAVTHVTSNAPTPDIESETIQGNPELKKADAELNSVYRMLQHKLIPAWRAALKQEQRAWLKTRDEAAEKAIGTGAADHKPAMVKALLEATRKRTIELKARMHAPKIEDQKPNTVNSTTGAFLIFDQQTSLLVSRTFRFN